MVQHIFSSSIEFSQYVEAQAIRTESNLIETLIMIIEELGLEPEQIKPLISDSLREKLRIEFADRGMLKKEVSTLTDFLV